MREEGRRDEGTLGVGFLGFVEKNRKRIGLVRELKKRLSFFRGFFGVEFFKNSSRARIFPDYVSLSLEITRVPGGRSPRSENKTATPLPSYPLYQLVPLVYSRKRDPSTCTNNFHPLVPRGHKYTRIRIHTVCIHVCRWRHENDVAVSRKLIVRRGGEQENYYRSRMMKEEEKEGGMARKGDRGERQKVK